MSVSKLNLAMALVLVVFAVAIQPVELKSASRQIDSDIHDGMVSQHLDELSSDESVSWSKVSSEEVDDVPLLQTTATKHHNKPKPTKSTRQEQDSEIAAAPAATPTTLETAATSAPAVTKPTSASAKPESTTTVPASTAAAAPSAVVPSQQVSASSTESTTKATTTTTTSKPAHHGHGLFGGGHQNQMNLPTLFKRKNDTVVTIRFIPLREMILEKIARFRNLFRKPETSTSKPETGSGSKHFHFKALG